MKIDGQLLSPRRIRHTCDGYLAHGLLLAILHCGWNWWRGRVFGWACVTVYGMSNWTRVSVCVPRLRRDFIFCFSLRVRLLSVVTIMMKIFFCFFRVVVACWVLGVFVVLLCVMCDSIDARGPNCSRFVSLKTDAVETVLMHVYLGEGGETWPM